MKNHRMTYPLALRFSILILIVLGSFILLYSGSFSSFAAQGGDQSATQQSAVAGSKIEPSFALSSPNSQSGGQFGSSVSASGSLVVVGAPGESVNGISGAGRAYVFNSTTGKLLRTLHSPNSQAGGSFGGSVAINGTNVIIGASGESAAGLSRAGHAYLFNALTGKKISTLSSPFARQDGYFGSQTAISGANALVSSSNETGKIGGLGRVYMFSIAGKLELNLSSPDPSSTFGTCFGVSLAISGNTFAVGQYDGCYYLLGWVNIEGEVQVYGTSGKLIVKLFDPYPPNSDAAQYFADSIAISGKSLLVGSAGKMVNGHLFSGAAYLFSTSGAYLRNFTSPKAQASGYFGNSVSMSGKLIVFGARLESYGKFVHEGSGYIFNTAGGLRSTLNDTNAQNYGYFGSSVSMSGGVVIVGAPGSSNGVTSSSGRAYVFIV